MGVSASVTMDTGMFIFCACADTHIHCCLSIKWVDQGVVYPIRLSSIFSYPACMAQEHRCPNNRGSTVLCPTFVVESLWCGQPHQWLWSDIEQLYTCMCYDWSLWSLAQQVQQLIITTLGFLDMFKPILLECQDIHINFMYQNTNLWYSDYRHCTRELPLIYIIMWRPSWMHPCMHAQMNKYTCTRWRRGPDSIPQLITVSIYVFTRYCGRSW